MFAVEVSVVNDAETVNPGPSKRRASRSGVQMPGRIANYSARSVCRVIDLSIAGARLQTYQPLEPQTVVMLTLPGQSERRARIVWSDDFMAGCAFDKPLPAAVLDDLIAIYGFVPAVPEIAMFRTQAPVRRA